jgi:hypothetical protein
VKRKARSKQGPRQPKLHRWAKTESQSCLRRSRTGSRNNSCFQNSLRRPFLPRYALNAGAGPLASSGWGQDSSRLPDWLFVPIALFIAKAAKLCQT